MLRTKYFLIFLFALKFFFDFMLPFREINFLIFNIICLIFLFYKVKLIRVRRSECQWILLYLMCCVLWLLVGGEFKYFVKFASIPIVYLTIKLTVSHLSIKDMEYVCKKVLTLFIFFLVSNYLISFMMANPASREFYNFEHANLLGSYVLLPLTFIYSLIMINGRSQVVYKLMIIVLAFFSTSTGAFLSSLIVLVNIKKLTAKSVLAGLLTGMLIVLCLYITTKTYFPELFVKVFGPLKFFLEGRGSELTVLAEDRLSLYKLGHEYQSSLMWRFYAYIVFGKFIFEQPVSSLIFGNGFYGFAKVWNGNAVHNDFLLILIDFGILGLGLTLYIFKKVLFSCVKSGIVLLPLLIVLILRMLLANNIYSYYLFSSLVMNGTFLFYVRQRVLASSR